jgi:ATPase subunit of ABC transporter with duplicated ATPase domains
MISLQNISYLLPNRDLLFENIHLSLSKLDKIALIGNNGSGKSTLLKLIAGELSPSQGQIQVIGKPYYIPQIFGQFNHLTIAQALGIESKLKALREILDGKATEENFNQLNDDWTVEERCQEAMAYWQLDQLDLEQKLATLSGGQKTKVFLAGIGIHQPELVLLDEPSNHLDTSSRELLYEFVRTTPRALLIVSHDRQLLQLVDTICELNRSGINVYGGNYEFYRQQKEMERSALYHDLKSKEKALQKAKRKERETLERQHKLSVRGKKKQLRAGTPKIVMNQMKNAAENSAAKMKSVHAEKTGDLANDLSELRTALPEIDKMKFGVENSVLHKGKILFKATELNFGYQSEFLWAENMNFQINSGERISVKGANGSGKTTLIKIILGQLEPRTGEVYRADNRYVYIDQDYSLIDHQLTVEEQAEKFNQGGLKEHEVKTRLNRFLFPREVWDKPCSALSGGERMRLMLCCLTIGNQSPDIMVLDEPTNNLDLQNIEILTAAINQYEGTLLVISHDSYFLEQIKVGRVIELKR